MVGGAADRLLEQVWRQGYVDAGTSAYSMITFYPTLGGSNTLRRPKRESQARRVLPCPGAYVSGETRHVLFRGGSSFALFEPTFIDVGSRRCHGILRSFLQCYLVFLETLFLYSSLKIAHDRPFFPTLRVG